ncbi:MAG: hypothetical protein ACREBU_06475 [Nitrososphaera sp.]
MSATNGSQGLKKIPIQAVSIALFALGGVIAALAIYQQFTPASSPATISKPYTISKEHAVRIALSEVDKEPNRDATFLPNEEARARLIHVADGGIGFIANEDSLEDMALYTMVQQFLKAYENKYIWHVDVYTSNDEGSRGYWYLIDANSGEVIGNDRDYAAFAVP